MTDDLLGKVMESVKKSGFPLQLRVADILQGRGYHVAHSLYFVDRDEGKGREIDLRGLFNSSLKADGRDHFVRHCILIECKKSARPWVVFTSPSTTYDPSVVDIAFRGMSSEDAWPSILELFGERFVSRHPFRGVPRRGRGYFEPILKGGSGSATDAEFGSNIYSALTTVAKAAIEMRDTRFAAERKSICAFYPIILFEGRLFEAYSGGNHLAVEEVESVIVSFFYRSRSYADEKFDIPIVRLQALPRLLESLEQATEALRDAFVETPDVFA